MRLKYFLLCLLLSPLMSLAQPVGDLTIFSEDGDKFFLILNGQRQNDVAQTNIRIEALNQPYYNAKIIFEDKGLGEITKNIPVTDPGSNAMMDVTYKIKKDGSGKAKLRYFSAIPPQQNYVAPSDVYVMNYGTPAGETVTQHTTTTTTYGGNNVNANVNVGGVNASVSFNDPNMNASVTQTTTTTTTTTSSSGYTESGYHEEHHSHQSGGRHGGGGDCYPMNANDFAQALQTVKDATYSETMLSTARSILAGNCLTSDQVVQMCNVFSFEESKLDFAKAAYPRTVDRNNYFKVVNAFTYSSSKEDLNNFISAH